MKKYKIFVIIAFLIIFPIRVYALTGTVSMNCGDNKVKAGGTISCSVTGTTDTPIFGVQAKAHVEGSASLTGFVSSNSDIWTYSGVKDDHVTVWVATASETGANGNFGIGSISLNVAENAEPGNVNISLSDYVFVVRNADRDVNVTEGITGSGVTINIVADETPSVSSDTGLRSLSCTTEGCDVYPPFSDGVYSYVVYLDSDSINSFSISAVAKDTDDSIVFTNADTDERLDPSSISFKTTGGKSDMHIKVKVGSGESLVEYDLLVSKASNSVAELASLTVGNKTINLVSGTYTYNVELTDVTTFQIKATPKDSENFVVDDTYLNRDFNESGSYGILVSPKDNSSGIGSQMYIINVVKRNSSSSSTVTPSNPTVNPKTGSFTTVVMAIVLIVSLFVTLHLYKNNIAGYKK